MGRQSHRSLAEGVIDEACFSSPAQAGEANDVAQPCRAGELSRPLRAALQREFPRGADVYEDGGLTKRDFMKLLGASMALAGIGLTGCRRPEAYLVPFNKGVEWTIPGKFLYYATAMPLAAGRDAADREHG